MYNFERQCSLGKTYKPAERKILLVLLNTNHSCVFVLTRSSLAKFSQCNSSQLYSRIKSNYTSLLIWGTLERDSKTSRRNSSTHFASFFNECRRFTASTVRVPCKSLRCFKSVLWTRLLWTCSKQSPCLAICCNKGRQRSTIFTMNSE